MPRINRKLTRAEIESAKPKHKPYKLCDDGGLVLLIRPTGSKVWQYPFKINGRHNIYTIGRHGVGAGYIKEDEARKQRDIVKDLLRQGINPNQSKQETKLERIRESKNSFEIVAYEWMSKQSWAPKHGKNIKSRLEKDVFKEIGYKSVKDITAKDYPHPQKD